MPYFNKILFTAFEISIFLFGYVIGRRMGKKEGIIEGMSIVPLDWRKQLFETSICPLYNQELNLKVNCDNVHNREL